MPAVNIADLTSDYRFHVRLLHPSDNAAQLEWLSKLYLAEADDRSGAEITASSFQGSSHSAQFRASTPEDRRNALRLAIEEVESLIDGAAASSLKRPFGFTFGPGQTPHTILG